jgi:hypothetical protein
MGEDHSINIVFPELEHFENKTINKTNVVYARVVANET